MKAYRFYKSASPFYLVMVLLLLITWGCEKEPLTLWAVYDETACSDPWGAHAVPDEVKGKNITAYFADKGIEILEVKFDKGHVHLPCAMCVCTTGTAILCKIKRAHLGLIEEEGFRLNN